MKNRSRLDAALGDELEFSAPQPASAESRFQIVRPDMPEAKPMQAVSRVVVRHAQAMARELGAAAVVVVADAFEGDDELQQLVRTVNFRTILISRTREMPATFVMDHCQWVTVPDVPMTRTGHVKVALVVCLAKGLLQRGDRVVCLTGIDGSSMIDTSLVLHLGSEPELLSMLDTVRVGSDVSPAVFERTLTIATQLAVEGREGRAVGAIFVMGDTEKVLLQSRPLVLNPFHGYPESDRNILDVAVEDTIKEFAAIDGAFIIRGDGVILTAGSQLLPTAPPPQLASGLGTRHAAAAAITASTDAVSLVVSQSTGTVTLFKSGQMITDIHKPANGGRQTI